MSRLLDVKLDEPEFYGVEEIFPDNPKPSKGRVKQMHNVDDDDDFTIRGRMQLARPERTLVRPKTAKPTKDAKVAKAIKRTGSKRTAKPTKKRRTTKKRMRKPSKK